MQLMVTAIDEYLTKDLTRQQATFLMNCESRHSFSLYFSRFTKHICQWITQLGTKYSIKINKENTEQKRDQPELLGCWRQFKIAVETIKITSIVVRDTAEQLVRKLEYAHVLLLGSKNGLGP